MGAANVAILFVYAVGTSLGQVLFKLAADKAKMGNDGQFLLSLLTNWYFYFGVSLYGALTVVWIWILTRVPLSQAYPFLVLAFVLTPAFGVLIFGETVRIWYLVSLALILIGLSLLVMKGA
jgi:drug/metabolite transporter (DMT)-like permease